MLKPVKRRTSLPKVKSNNDIEPEPASTAGESPEPDEKNGQFGDLEIPIPIRAHTLLCLQGYKGLGYSPEFIAKMDQVHGILSENPNIEVKVIIGADVFCVACPHHHRGRCMVDDPEDQPVPTDSPDSAILSDRRVLSWLELKEGDVEYWGSILHRIGKNVDSSVMDILCGDCQWREYGHCAEALDELSSNTP